MRALLIPQVSTYEVEAESDVYSHKCVQRGLQALGPAFCYWWLRQGDEERVVERPGEMWIHDELPMSFYQQMAAVNLGRLVDLFSWQRGLYPVDVVFCSRAGVAPLISLALADMSGMHPVPVVITEPRVYGPGEEGHNLAHPVQLALRAAGYASCFGMYWSRWEREQALLAASQFCQPGVMKAMEDRAFVVDALVDVTGIRPYTMQRRLSPKRLLFAGRLNSNKRYREIVEAYSKVLMGRTEKDLEVWIHSGTGAFSKLEAADHRWHRTSERLSREEYWKVLGGSHVGAYLSHDEGANVTVQEMLAAEIVLALPDRPWVQHLFEPLEYPFRVKSERELPALLDWLLDHWGEALQRLQPIRTMIEQERSWSAFQTKFSWLMEAVAKVPRPPAYRVFRKIVKQLIDEPVSGGQVSLASALRCVAQWQKGAPEFSAVRGMMACYEAVRDLDDAVYADPRLVGPVLPEEAHAGND
jgi:hypothetical protein